METTRFIKADPKAPRFRQKEFDVLSGENREFYSAMKKQYPTLKKYSNSDIANCIKLFNVRIANEVINNRNGVRLSDGLGIIVVGACKIAETYSPDYNTSTILGKAVPHQNLHSDNYIGKIKYTNALEGHTFNNNDLWMFDGCRNFTRAVSAEFKAGNHKRYIVFNTYEHMAHLFRKQKIQKEGRGTEVWEKKKLDDYDEFAFN